MVKLKIVFSLLGIAPDWEYRQIRNIVRSGSPPDWESPTARPGWQLSQVGSELPSCCPPDCCQIGDWARLPDRLCGPGLSLFLSLSPSLSLSLSPSSYPSPSFVYVVWLGRTLHYSRLEWHCACPRSVIFPSQTSTRDSCGERGGLEIRRQARS